MREILLSICPDCNIFEVPVRDRKGPVHAVSLIFDNISDSQEIIVSYCDYGTWWSYEKFLKDNPINKRIDLSPQEIIKRGPLGCMLKQREKKKLVNLLDQKELEEPTQDESTQDEPIQDESTQDEPTQDEPIQDEFVEEEYVEESVQEHNQDSKQTKKKQKKIK